MSASMIVVVADGVPARRARTADAYTAAGFECWTLCSGWDLIDAVRELHGRPYVVVAHVGSLYPDPRDIVVLARLSGSRAPFVLYGDHTDELAALSASYAPVTIVANADDLVRAPPSLPIPPGLS